MTEKTIQSLIGATNSDRINFDEKQYRNFDQLNEPIQRFRSDFGRTESDRLGISEISEIDETAISSLVTASVFSLMSGEFGIFNDFQAGITTVLPRTGRQLKNSFADRASELGVERISNQPFGILRELQEQLENAERNLQNIDIKQQMVMSGGALVILTKGDTVKFTEKTETRTEKFPDGRTVITTSTEREQEATGVLGLGVLAKKAIGDAVEQVVDIFTADDEKPPSSEPPIIPPTRDTTDYDKLPNESDEIEPVSPPPADTTTPDPANEDVPQVPVAVGSGGITDPRLSLSEGQEGKLSANFVRSAALLNTFYSLDDYARFSERSFKIAWISTQQLGFTHVSLGLQPLETPNFPIDRIALEAQYRANFFQSIQNVIINRPTPKPSKQVT